MKARIAELVSVERPISQGAMHYVGIAELVAAVSGILQPIQVLRRYPGAVCRWSREIQ
jgi:NAD(P)H-dependent flavin oxidoreductase YrpB (nitropropane dioxygenase family)